MKKIKVNTNLGSYPVYIGSNILKNLKYIFKENKINFEKSLVVIDQNVPKECIKIIKKKLNKNQTFFYYFKPNEKNKNLFEVNKIIKFMLEKNFSRNDCVIAVGGGSVGDFSSFVASIFKRGLRFINSPSTLLAQVDASIGGKNGVNDQKFGKNLIGTFYQPSIVISDSRLLKFLNKKQVTCGYAEILKHSLIADKKNFRFLKRNFNKIINLDNSYINKTILMSCKIKKNVVENDETEKNLRKILNFGHTFGHAYEAASGFKKTLSHGEGVILGMKTAIKFSLNKKILKLKVYNEINDHINKINPKLKLNNYFQYKDINTLVRLMRNDKKNKNSKINLVLLRNISRPIISNSYNPSEIKTFFRKELVNL